MKSMTGFGHTEYQDEKYHLIINLKSGNNRFLDIVIYLPKYLLNLEAKLRSYIASKVNRGRVELTIKLSEIKENVDVHMDKDTINTYMSALKELVKSAGINEKITLSHLLRIEGIIKPIKIYDTDKHWKILKPLLDKTFKEFEQLREIEGRRTDDFIVGQIENIKENIKVIESMVSQIEVKIKEVLYKKFKELLGNEIDETRILSEIAILLIKFDIKEEISRLDSHIKSFVATRKEGGPVGKKLDFICQEINREINTIGSKSIILDISNSVISIKNSVESIREQLRNVE